MWGQGAHIVQFVVLHGDYGAVGVLVVECIGMMDGWCSTNIL